MNARVRRLVEAAKKYRDTGQNLHDRAQHLLVKAIKRGTDQYRKAHYPSLGNSGFTPRTKHRNPETWRYFVKPETASQRIANKLNQRMEKGLYGDSPLAHMPPSNWRKRAEQFSLMHGGKSRGAT